MGRRASNAASTADAVNIALAHAVRRWEAEVENDRKLTHRENGLLTLVAAVLGLGLFRIDAWMAPGAIGWAWIARGSLVACVAMSCAALAKLLLVSTASATKAEPLRPGRDSRPIALASGHLRWPEGERLLPSSLGTPLEAGLLACELSTRAATSLYFRNLARSRALDSGQRFLFGSALFAGLTLACYVFQSPR